MSAKIVGLLFWLLIGGLAAASAYWQATHPPQPPVMSEATKRPLELPAVTPMQPFRLLLPAQYAEINARPLFIATRRPEPPPPPEEEPPPKPPTTPEQKLMLLGIVISPGMQAALLRPEEPNAKTAQIKLGETVGEWQLEAIFPNRVVVRKGQETQELMLTRLKKSPGPRGGRAGVKPVQGMTPPPAQMPVVVPSNMPPPPMASPPAPQIQGE